MRTSFLTVLAILVGSITPPAQGWAQSPEAFEVAIDEATVERVRSRFADARFPDRIAGGGWDYGASHDFLERFAAFMAKDFDWSAAETRLNSYPQYQAEIDGLDIHFYHVRGEGENPTPVILTHGWPGSVFEFLEAIDPLTRPSAYGGDPDDALSVVIPSLPGFGFSEAPSDRPIGPATTADLWNTLMTDVLGYSRYGAQGGDLGCLVTTQLAIRHAENLVGIHLNLVPWSMRPVEELTEEERAWLVDVGEFSQAELAYFGLQATKPATPGFALVDSPMGTAAWILEKIQAWSDNDGTVTNAFTLNELGTLVSLYTLTETIDSSIWFYNGFLAETGGSFLTTDFVDVPTGVARFPEDLLNGMPPKSWVKAQYDLVHWTEMPRGGHFAALEEPELFAADVLSFFSKLED